MRTIVHAAFLATTLLSGIGAAGPVLAADLDHYYEPRPVPVLPPSPPPCGFYRPCWRPHPRFGYAPPPRFRYGYVERDYAPRRWPREGEDHYGYEHRRPPYDRYGFDRPGMYPYQPPRYGRLDHYGDDERRREDERFFERGPGPGYGGGGYGRDPYDRG